MKTDCCNKTTWTSSSCSSAPCCDCGGASPRTTLPVPARTRCPRALIVVTLFCLRALARHLHRCCVACLCGPVVPSSPSTLDDCVNHRNDGSRPLGKIGWKPSCHTGTGTSQAIDSLISSRLLNASSYIACDNRSPLAAQARNYRSVGGDPARSEPTYVRVCSLWSNSIDSSSAHGDCRFFNQGELHAICCPSLVRKLDPAQAHTTSCQSVVPGFARLFCLLASSSLAAQPPCGEVTAQAFLGLRRHWSASAIKTISKSIL